MLYSLEKISVLLVDDDQDDIDLFQLAFSKVKVKSSVSYLKNGLEAIEYFQNPENEIPSILFLDLNMPLMGGKEVLYKLRADERFRNLPIAIYSTSNSEGDIEDTLSLGANIYIVKPYNFTKLIEIIEKVLKVQWQYETSQLDIRNYLLVVE